MNTQTKTQKTVINVEPMAEWLNNAIFPKHLAEYLDQTIFNYAQLLIKTSIKGEFIHEGADVELWFLFELSRVLKLCEVTE